MEFYAFFSSAPVTLLYIDSGNDHGVCHHPLPKSRGENPGFIFLFHPFCLV